MGAYQITNIRVSDPNTTSTEKITEIKLSRGDRYSGSDIIMFIQNRHEFFYISSRDSNSKAYIEVVYPAHQKPYIKTKSSSTAVDNLLKLPRF